MGNTASARRRRHPPRRREPSKPHQPTDPPILQTPHRNPQTACPMFGPRFPLELRLLIYEAVFSDPKRLMHVIPFIDGYVESLDVLYATNRFSVQASFGLRAFHSVTPASQWARIRHLEISTLFLMPLNIWSGKRGFPPEHLQTWTLACEALKKLRGIRYLFVEMLVWDLFDRVNASAVDDDSLVTILQPLNGLEAPHFVVEMNIAIPKSVLARLGKLAFVSLVKTRRYVRQLDTGL
ncbi:hypothetical protein DM02DRAFT_561213 [Periconia macrospinosa]|uniref:DUF7730 domain-containing protein n=1 Tax=Periconia macrospinosa TaxID=97972 RepID=A0A2V1DWE2_9PLEO|nr:hypothetical protein DM02DRAFT_561213 [Periconia macrospinosa]